MKEITIAGGYYRERCVALNVDDSYGSGGRAAIGFALNGIRVSWHYYCPDALQSAASIILNHPNLSHQPTDSNSLISFRYFHTLSKPTFTPDIISKNPPIHVDSEVVLRFGYMEGEAIVNADYCVYDPQSHKEPIPFKQNGSKAKKLAIVLNATEVLKYGFSQTESDAVKNIHKNDGAEVILVKAGTDGCRVYINSIYEGTIPPYWSNKIYKIGTGDVFSAAFANYWALHKLSVLEAADYASRCVARYCESRTPNVELDDNGKALEAIKSGVNGKVYIAGPFFTMSELWLVEETYAALNEMGIIPFSPYHHIGIGLPSQVVGPDLKGLTDSNCVIALLDGCDPGSIFEVGYATKMGIPVIGLSQNNKESDLTMLLGSSNCSITDDFATAIYHAVWKARK